MNKIVNKIKDYAGKGIRFSRVARRLAGLVAVLPVAAGAVAAQMLVAGPVFKNYTFVPNLLVKVLRRLMGIKVVFNQAAAPVVRGRPTWFVSNHISTADPFAESDKLNGSFAGKGDFMKNPFVAKILRSVKYIGLRRSNEFNPQSRGKIIAHFNRGSNLIMYPEATTSDDGTIKMFHAGLITALFGEKGVDEAGNDVKLTQDVVVQPVAIRVVKVDRKNAIGNVEMARAYTQEFGDGLLRGIYNRLAHNVTVEVTTLPPLHPSDFADARELINHAAQDVANIVNPGQTTFEKAVIPHKNKKHKNKDIA